MNSSDRVSTWNGIQVVSRELSEKDTQAYVENSAKLKDVRFYFQNLSAGRVELR